MIAADPDSSTENNSGSDSPESAAPAPYLVIENISWEPATPYEKDNMKFEVTLENKGSGPSGKFNATCYIGGDEVSLNSVSGLEAGSNTSFTFDWVPSSSGNLNIKAVADADTQVLESAEGNNEEVESFAVRSPYTSSFSSSRSSGGGGGGAGSPEPTSNVEVKELSQEFITNGNHVKFKFLQNVTCITYVEFEPKRSLGKVTAIVEMLKGQSKIVPTSPSGEVYRYVNIRVGNRGVADPKNIENAVVGF
ncbi:PGF-pre-PGF domain-containing protein [Methanosarcina sp. KYL-1]|nr:PGF-pre-PGF domain-containing protein [Methanosarcina sp. KYL-1]